MHIGFLNPHGNFDKHDSYISEHPDFGGQLIYVKQLAIEMANNGHRVDILTRQIIDPNWQEFALPFDHYPGVENVRIIRLPAGSPRFLQKEHLWQYLITDWVPNILKFYQDEGSLPALMTAHYGDGGLCGVLIAEKTGIPFTFTAHSLGAQKMDKLGVNTENLAQMNAEFNFGQRIMAERLSMNRSAVNITSTKEQERFEQYSHQVYREAVNVNDESRFVVIPPGVDPTMFSSQARSPNEDATYQLIIERLARDILPERRNLPVILAASRLAPKKNTLGLVKAFAMSKTLQKQANLVLITAGMHNPLQEKAKDEQVEQKVLMPIREVIQEKHLSGKISAFCVPDQGALAATYRFFAKRRSIFVLVSLYEPFGLAPLEAVATGLPVVVTKNGGLSESLRDGTQEYGVLVDPADPLDIVKGLESLLGDTQTWDHFAVSGMIHVHNFYTWQATARGYLQLIEEIVASPNQRRCGELLPIPDYFLNPKPETNLALDELSCLYLGLAKI
jgi:sucrose-phosphate synthase